MKNWNDLVKGSNIISTFNKMNVKGDDGNIKLNSSIIFLDDSLIKDTFFNYINYQCIRYIFIVSYIEDDETNTNTNYMISWAEDGEGFKCGFIKIDLNTLINFMYEGLNTDLYHSRPSSLNEFLGGGTKEESTKFWVELGNGIDVNKIISNGVFLFCNLTWWNVVFAFKLSNIDLNGGKISSRHIMKPSDFILGEFVRNILMDSDVRINLNNINKIYSTSYKNENLSAHIDLKLCEKYKLNESAIRNKLYNDGEKNKGKEEEEEYIIKKYLLYNYGVYYNYIRKEILSEFEGVLLVEQNKLNSLERRNIVILCGKGSVLYESSFKSRNEKKRMKKWRREGVKIISLEEEESDIRLKELREKIFNKKNLILHLKSMIDKEKKENNDFNNNDLIYLENYRKNLKGKIEEWIRKGKENRETHTGNESVFFGGNWEKRGYHTSVRGGQVFKSLINEPFCMNKKICCSFGENLEKRYYSNYSIEDKIYKKDENFSKFNFKELRENFLNEVSLFNKRLKEMIDEGNKCEEERINLQKRIEEYCINYEYDWHLKFFKKENDNNRFDPLFLNAMKDWYFKIEQDLINYMHEYEINDFENLIKGIKKKRKDTKVEVILVIFAMKYFVIERNNKNEENLKNFISKLEASKKEEKWLFKKLDGKFSQKELYNIISLIIRTIVYLISNSMNNEDNDVFETTQAYLTTTLGEKVLKRLGKQLPDTFLNKFNDVDKKVVENYYKDNLINPTDDTIGNIGANLLELIMDSVDIFETKKKTVNNKTNIYIKISYHYIKMFSNRLLHPNKLPMIVSPLNWKVESEDEGGYINCQYKNLINANLVHRNKRNRYKNELGIVQYDTINYLNKQRFKIDKDMLDFLLVEYNKDCSIVFEGKNKYDDTIVDESNKNRIKSHNSKYLLYRYVISLAIAYESIYFYIPTFLDFRGRVYSIVDYLTYQGEDMARSLITFYEGCEINKDNIIYALQHLANTAGKSKLTIKNKNKWATNFINQLNLLPVQLDYKELSTFFETRKNNVDLFEDIKVSIFDLAEIENVKKIMSNNDEKLQFLNILFSLIKCLIKHNELFCTSICFDATTSGFQHLAALFQDIELAKASNVVNNKEDDDDEENDIENVNRGDVYQKVADKAIEFIKKEEKDENLKNKFLKININRKILKKPCMTVPYNVGLKTMHLDLINTSFFIKKVDAADIDKKDKTTFFIVSKDILKEDVSEPVVLRYDEMFKFSKFLYDSVYKTFPSLEGYVKYLNQFAHLIVSLNKPVMWTTPVGMKIYMGYNQFEQKNTNVFFKKRKRGSIVNLPINKIDKLANKIAFMPNFIHSMDSANVQLLIKNLIIKNEFINLFTIHDCFASTPETMRLLNFEVRRAFAMIYFDQNYIYIMHRNFLNQIRSHTTIYEDNGFESIPLDIAQIEKTDTAKNENLFILVDKKRMNIPKIPFNVDWELVKGIFEKGIIKSLYFIN
uniref:DNA-directed RNA polymerase n=1 Tax=Termitomyces titanicus TaxID=201775 RepID=A0A8F1D6F3_TERTA|nr:RNA polymerase [Termitomyces titanicus]